LATSSTSSELCVCVCVLRFVFAFCVLCHVALANEHLTSITTSIFCSYSCGSTSLSYCLCFQRRTHAVLHIRLSHRRTTAAPWLALKFVSLFDSEVASVLPRWKKDENYDTAPVVALLGHPLRSPEECIVEMAGSIASFGLAKKVCVSLILLLLL
jgi:hypothetical protein